MRADGTNASVRTACQTFPCLVKCVRSILKARALWTRKYINSPEIQPQQKTNVCQTRNRGRRDCEKLIGTPDKAKRPGKENDKEEKSPNRG